MSFTFELLPEHDTVLISATGAIGPSDIRNMRRRTVEIARETGYCSFIMDIKAIDSIDKGNTFEIFELGDEFSSTGFPLRSRTAVIMPDNPAAKKQAEFLHTVEQNRGRGVMKYVESREEALGWLSLAKPDKSD